MSRKKNQSFSAQKNNNKKQTKKNGTFKVLALKYSAAPVYGLISRKIMFIIHEKMCKGKFSGKMVEIL